MKYSIILITGYLTALIFLLFASSCTPEQSRLYGRNFIHTDTIKGHEYIIFSNGVFGDIEHSPGCDCDK